ncbi:acyl-CoA dehydrogenase family protein [Streptomyces sp. NPDC005811]|uniref:acyl-CoA dehydrogenase family protein n=1 Tax=Streptomyces sp. NPDC005811 TaxID=3154565 RepID=UPI0033E69461
MTSTARERVADLEARFGDPYDDANPLGYAAVLAADERGELPAEGERMLDDFCLNAEFVPQALGGRLTQADEMALVLRSVFRRDCALGLGYGITNYIAAAPVWASGSAPQQLWMADLLLAGGKAAAGYNELAHGNDFTRVELAATRHGDDLVLDGGKQVVNNLARADAAVFLARTSAAAGPRSHSHVLVDLRDLPGDRHRRLPRFPTAGVRGCRIGGVEFTACPVPQDAGTGIVGGAGRAMETVLKAFQTTRGVLPGVALGGADTQLRTVVDFALERRLYGLRVADLPYTRATLTAAYLDLLAGDCLATTAARALHVLPDQTSVYTAAAKFLVPKMIQESSHALATLLGARSYLREGPYGIFQKQLRDLPAATFGHANSTVCLATIIPQLSQLAHRSWSGQGAPAPAELFRFGGALPALDFGPLAVNARGADGLAGELLAAAAEFADEPVLGALCGAFTAELAELRERCAALRPRERTVTAGPESFVLAERYTVVLAAAACLGYWRHGERPGSGTGDAPAWLLGALHRLAARLGRGAPLLPDGIESRVWDDLTHRHEERLSFDTAALRLAG